MQFTLSKKIWFVFAAIVLSISILFFSCQKELSSSGIDLGTETPDLTTKIASSVSGFVTDENEVAVDGATIVFGSTTTTTDKFGYFAVRNVQVSQTAAMVTVIKPGYFKGIKTYIPTANKSAFFRIKLLTKSTAGNIDAATGGSAALSNGLSVTLPAGAVVNAANNSVYSGPVTVAAQWLNPAAADTWRAMPGDLRGLDDNGSLKLLQTYGMSAIELTGSSGELLQIAAGKKASLNFPLPTAIAGAAPASIPLWYFDETNGLWKQEGSAVKSGNNYVGEVSHFSYWNCDIPLTNSVQFNCTVVDENGNPMPNVSVEVKYANAAYTGAHGYTDSSGYVNGVIPANSQLILEIYSGNNCGAASYTQTITTTASNLSLGNITVGTSSTATINGNVTDCNSAPVSDGYVILQYGYNNYKTILKPDGTFTLNILTCSANLEVSIIAINNASLQQSNSKTLALVMGPNNAGTLNACGTSIAEFINYTVNGTNYTITGSTGSFYGAVSPVNQNSQPGVYIKGSEDSIGQSGHNLVMTFDKSGIAVNSKQNLLTLSTQQINDSANIGSPILVNITEYGAPGEFIAGNFAGTVTGAPPANKTYNITCNFRVKRSQ